LAVWVAEALPAGSLQPSVTGGARATVTELGWIGAPPAWMSRLADELTEAGIKNWIE